MHVEGLTKELMHTWWSMGPGRTRLDICLPGKMTYFSQIFQHHPVMYDIWPISNEIKSIKYIYIQKLKLINVLPFGVLPSNNYTLDPTYFPDLERFWKTWTEMLWSTLVTAFWMSIMDSKCVSFATTLVWGTRNRHSVIYSANRVLTATLQCF